VTRPPLPWWSAHVAGLIVCHGVFWFGVWRFAAYLSLPEAVWSATVVPPVVILWMWPCTLCAAAWVIVLVLRVRDVPRHRRWPYTFAIYMVLAVTWWWASMAATAFGIR
jgi:hypothetical protein